MTTKRQQRLQQPPPQKPPVALLDEAPLMIALDLREQSKLDEIMQSSLNAQANLEKARQDVEQQGGRLVGALEAILDRKGLDPKKHRWSWDGQHVTITASVA